jgi:hypothetical protein
MGVLSMFSKTLTPSPHWIKKVEKNGMTGTATVLTNPSEIMKGVAGYQGRDLWIDFEADVLTDVGEEYKAKVKCRLSQALGGMIEPGMKVNVRYDPNDKTRVVLVDDVQTLLNYRVKSGGGQVIFGSSPGGDIPTE